MQIEYIICAEHIEEKLWVKHHVTMNEVRQVFSESPHYRYVEKGYVKGEDVYAALGQTFGGRYLTMFFVYKPTTKTVIIVSARDMSDKERKKYGRK